jgi:two-component system response regulator DevR
MHPIRMHPIRVVVVDDHELVLDGLASVLRREQDIDVVGTAVSAEQALPLIEDVKPDVAVVDYGLPGMSGNELCQRLAADHADVAVVIITNYLDEQVLVRAMQVGARGFAYKDVRGEDLKWAIRVAANGGTALDSKASRRIFTWAQQGRFRRKDVLAPREVEILRLIARGSTNPEIADALGISHHTVKSYLNRVLRKLACHSRSEAATIAAKRGLL